MIVFSQRTQRGLRRCDHKYLANAARNKKNGASQRIEKLLVYWLTEQSI